MSPAGDRFPDVRARLAAFVPRRTVPGPGHVQAAVAVVLAPGSTDDLDLLFIKRAEYDGDPWSGHLALPGGRRQSEDEDLLTTAIRETAEEVGIPLSNEALLGELDDLSPVAPHLPQVIVRPYVFGLPAHPPVTPSAEVALHLWVPRDVLESGHRTEPLVILGQRREVPGYRVGGHFIWGMTERIVSPFLELLR